MTKLQFVNVRALFYVLQQVMKRGRAYFDTASIWEKNQCLQPKSGFLPPLRFKTA